MADIKTNSTKKPAPYPEYIERALHEMLDINGSSKEEIHRLYTLNEVFDAVLEHKGISGYGGKIRRLVLEVYRINLNEVRD